MTTPTTVTPEAPRMPAPAPARPRPGRLASASGILRDAPPPPPHVGHPLLAFSAELAAGSMAHALHASPWWILAATGPAALVAPFVTHHRFTNGAPEAALAVAGTAAAGGWLAWAAATTPWSATSLGTLAVATTALGPVYGLLRWRRDGRNRKAVVARVKAREDAKRRTWEAILAKAGAKGVTVEDGDAFGAGFKMPLTLGPDSPDYTSLQSMIPAIERIAAHVTKLPIRSGSIQIQREDGMMAHQAVMIVPTRDVLAEMIELPDWHGPRSIKDPLSEGTYVDGNEVQHVFRGFHSLISGMTNYGKSALLDTDLAQLVRCVDNVTFCLAGNKAVRWLRPWLLPWLRGYAAVPPIDWVAPNVDEALRCLLDIYRAIDGRQAMPGNGETGWEPTAEAPQITLLVDESTDLLDSTKKVKTHKGESVTFSQLLLKIVRTARSEAIQVKFCSQRGTATLLGGEGGDLKSQVGGRYGLRAMGNMTDVNAVFSSNTNGIDLSLLPKGAWYIELEGMDRPRLAKGYWTAPKRISEYAIEATAYVGGLDQPTAALMEHYAGRWSRPGQIKFLEAVNGGPLPEELMGVLAGAEPAGGNTPTAQGPDGEQSQAQDVYEAAGDYDDTDVMKRIAAWAGKKADANDVAMLELMFNEPAIAEDDRTTREPATPLPPETLELLGVLRASGVLYSGEEWIPAVDVRAMAAKSLSWPDNPEGDRKVAAALRGVQIESKRKGKDRVTSYQVAELRQAAERHGDTGGS